MWTKNYTLVLEGIIYTQFPKDFYTGIINHKQGWDAIIATISTHARELTQGANPCHYFCSTINYLSISDQQTPWQLVTSQMQKSTRLKTRSCSVAYECAGWGFILRYLLNEHLNKNQAILITIFDVDLNGFSSLHDTPPWGRSGFGITSLLFKVNQLNPDNADSNLILGCVSNLGSLCEYGYIIKKAASQSSTGLLALPFFAPEAYAIIQKALANTQYLPNLYFQFGHCFGSDPWLACLQHLQQNPRQESMLATSFALNGYYAILNFNVAQNIKLNFYYL